MALRLARVGVADDLIQLEQEGRLGAEDGSGLKLEQSDENPRLLPLGAKGRTPRRDTILQDR